MKIFKRTTFFALLIISFCLTNCRKEEMNKKSNPVNLYQGVHSSNGVLIFDSDSTFNEILQSSLEKSDDELDLWESEFENFQSYRSLFLKVKKLIDLTESEDEYKRVINKYADLLDLGNEHEGIESKYSSDLFSRFYNSNGIFQIGDKMVVYDKTSVSTTKSLNIATLKELRNSKSNIKTEIFDNKVVLSRLNKIKTNGTVSYSSIVFGAIYAERVVDGKRRLYISVFNDYNPSNNSGIVYLKLSQQKKNIFGWTDNETRFHINDYSWDSLHNTSSPEQISYHSGSSLGYSTGDAYSHYIFFIPDYFGLSMFNLNGSFTSGGVPNTDRTIIYMNDIPNN